jgi:ParB-like chromosome segregation protein Spo0J
METQIQIPESDDIGIITSIPTLSGESAGSDSQRLISAIKYVAVGELKAHPDNTEIYGSTPDEELLENIKMNGIIQPLLVTWENVVLSGHRRLHCAMLAGLSQVPVVFTESTDTYDMLELLLDANVQRQKSDAVVAREIQLWMKIEAMKAKKRKATAMPGKCGGQLDPAKSPEGTGDARDAVARKLGIGAKKVDAAVAVMAKIDDLWQSGETAKADEVANVLETQSINAAKKMVKELAPPKAHSHRQAQPAKTGVRPLRIKKSELIERITRDMTRELEKLPVDQIEEFEKAMVKFQAGWRQSHPIKVKVEVLRVAYLPTGEGALNN